jgi:N-acetylglucosaminyl-diphospho-decaprenol L-rhamnosyltransferase
VLNDPASVEAEAIADLRQTCAVISPSSPQGYGANLNLGVRALDRDVDCFLLANDDVVFPEGTLVSLVDALSDLRVGIAGPTVIWGDGKSTQPGYGLPRLLEAFNPQGMVLPRPLWEALQERRRHGGTEAITAVPGAAMVVRRSAFEAVGGFDEDFFLYWEETDLCFRLARAGWKLAWAEDAVVTHLGGSSIASDRSQALSAQSLALYFKKRVGRFRWIGLSFVFLAVFTLSGLYAVAASVARPSTAARRLELLRSWWRGQLFFPPRRV